MRSRVDDLLEHIARLEHELEIELTRARVGWRYRIEAGRVRFLNATCVWRTRGSDKVFPRFLRESSLASLLSAPVIYSMIVPIALLDAWITAYQTICFPLYGIARVRRSAYVVFDRQHLAYLNAIEKLNCVYCGYANGVFAYVREIAGRTEQYWCPIRHAKRVRAPHLHYRHFVDYGDADGYRKELPALRTQLADDAEGKDD